MDLRWCNLTIWTFTGRNRHTKSLQCIKRFDLRNTGTWGRGVLGIESNEAGGPRGRPKARYGLRQTAHPQTKPWTAKAGCSARQGEVVCLCLNRSRGAVHAGEPERPSPLGTASGRTGDCHQMTMSPLRTAATARSTGAQVKCCQPTTGQMHTAMSIQLISWDDVAFRTKATGSFIHEPMFNRILKSQGYFQATHARKHEWDIILNALILVYSSSGGSGSREKSHSHR